MGRRPPPSADVWIGTALLLLGLLLGALSATAGPEIVELLVP